MKYRRLTPATISAITRRLERSWNQEWDPEHREEFSRVLSTMSGDLPVANQAIDELIRTQDWRPSIAQFDAALARARREGPGVLEPAPPQREITDVDREAMKFFLPRLKKIMAGIGSGPQPGAKAACDALVAEWQSGAREPHEDRGRLL
jgi:hypothetical protein